MRQLTGSWTPADGALLRVQVGVSQSDLVALRAAARPIPQPLTLTALLDTGAEVSCIDPSEVARLGLSWYGTTLANLPAAGGLTAAVQYNASIHIPHPSGKRRDAFEIPDLILTELPIGALGYEMLLGRDLLVLCAFRLDGPSLTFTLDY